MANPQLTVEIGAKIDGLRDSFNRAIREIDGLDKDTKSKLSSIDKAFAKLANDIDASMSKASSSTSKASNSISKDLSKVAQASANSGTAVKKGSNEAAFALTNLGRVAQDAPFGFIGIQNNINPLLESFQRLQKETGSTGSALKALAGGLVGAGGLGLAVSAITAAITFAQMGFRAWGVETKKAEDANKSYLDSIDQVTAAKIRGSQAAQKDITDVRLLYEAYQNANLPLKDRKIAYAELQKQYPAYFGNLTFEEKAGKNTADAYNQLTTSILAAARARAASDAISKNASREFENENKRIDARIKLEDALAKRKTAETFLGKLDTDAQLSGVRAKYEKEISGYSDIIAENTKIIREANVDSNKLSEQNNRLSQIATGEKVKQLETTREENKELEKQGNKIAEIYKRLSSELKSNPLAFGASDFDVVESNIKSYQKAIDDLIQNGYNPASKAVQDLIDKQIELAKSFISTQNVLASAASNKLAPEAQQRLDNRAMPEAQLITTLRPPVGLTEYQKLINEAIESNERFISSIGDLAESTLTSGLSDAFASIGTALAEGTNAIDAFGTSLLSAFAGFLSQLGQMFIKEGIAQIGYGIAKNLILPGSGANNIAGGAGMIAAGGVISAIGGAMSAKGKGSKSSSEAAKPIRQFATGGYNLPGGLAMVGENGPEFVKLPVGSSVHNNTKTNRILEGANKQSIVLGGEVGISMETLYFKLKDTEKRISRI